MKNLSIKCKIWFDNMKINAKRVLKNTDGDQITGWLIVILLVVVVGAFFLNSYQSAILNIWKGIVNKMKDTFGI